jgi:hypothetical protein
MKNHLRNSAAVAALLHTIATSIRRRLSLIVVLALACGLPALASADDYPNGATATGVVTQVLSWGPELLFVVTGTTDAGTSGSTAFFIDCTQPGAGTRVANILAAAAQTKTVHIWNYGTPYSYGGQSGYLSAIEIVYY